MLCIFTLFGIGTAWNSMRETEKNTFQKRKGAPPYNEEFNRNKGGGVEIFLHARFLATFKLILSVHFNTVTEVA